MVSIGIITLSPVFILIILAIRLEGFFILRSKGPSFVHEIQISQHRAFQLWKFRTFYHNDDLPVDELENTKVGGLLLKFYLDEFPQLLNTLLGHMPLVGPRPTPRTMYKRTIKAGYMNKLVLRTGLCGLVQYMKGNWRKIGKYLSVDEALIYEYETRGPLGII